MEGSVYKLSKNAIMHYSTSDNSVFLVLLYNDSEYYRLDKLTAVVAMELDNNGPTKLETLLSNISKIQLETKISITKDHVQAAISKLIESGFVTCEHSP